MAGGWTEVLTDPRTFFERRGEGPSIRGPVVIVGTVAVLGTVASLFTFQGLADAVAEDAGELLAGLQVFTAVVGFVLPFLVWLLYAVAFFVVSAFLDGEGSFRDVALLTAWGFLPQVLDALAGLVATVVATGEVTAPEVTSPEEFSAYADQVAAHPASVAATVLGIVLLLWSAYIWVAAVQESRGLDRGAAIITVAVPVAVALLFRTFGLLGALF
ncbi:hypothetical protein BRC81_04155 [Halobacteriales archaeon QS_1_68_20]|nr:MAG: hypothetical protein BRC81_04155 [Halobacteriales archaeon QS_1_68_20]